EVDGTFDDCQALLKSLFRDEAFRDRVQLSGVNSINWARIVPQIAYYFYAAANLGAPYRPVSFAVPTGNFGDIFAGYAAKRMGLGVDRLTIASNSNDILPRTVASGVYEQRGVVATMSPSMDIEVSSNFERLLFEIQGRDAALVRSQMASLVQSGRFEVKGGAATLAGEFQASAATEDDAAACIRRVKTATGYIVEPHTACGVVAAERLLSSRNAPAVVLATAHAAKFPEAMAQVLGQHVELPGRLVGLMSDPERAIAVKNDINDVQRVVEGHLNAVDEVF
ncbi:MAG: threonine synthase, partial [Hyphomicrobiaceae bacterium]